MRCPDFLYFLKYFCEEAPEYHIAAAGSLTENYVAQVLKAKGYDLYYWTSESPVAELDFVFQKEGKVIPIEVKSGEHVKAKSLMHFVFR